MLILAVCVKETPYRDLMSIIISETMKCYVITVIDFMVEMADGAPDHVAFAMLCYGMLQGKASPQTTKGFEAFKI